MDVAQVQQQQEHSESESGEIQEQQQEPEREEAEVKSLDIAKLQMLPVSDAQLQGEKAESEPEVVYIEDQQHETDQQHLELIFSPEQQQLWEEGEIEEPQHVSEVESQEIAGLEPIIPSERQQEEKSELESGKIEDEHDGLKVESLKFEEWPPDIRIPVQQQKEGLKVQSRGSFLASCSSLTPLMELGNSSQSENLYEQQEQQDSQLESGEIVGSELEGEFAESEYESGEVLQDNQATQCLLHSKSKERGEQQLEYNDHGHSAGGEELSPDNVSGSRGKQMPIRPFGSWELLPAGAGRGLLPLPELLPQQLGYGSDYGYGFYGFGCGYAYGSYGYDYGLTYGRGFGAGHGLQGTPSEEGLQPIDELTSQQQVRVNKNCQAQQSRQVLEHTLGLQEQLGHERGGPDGEGCLVPLQQQQLSRGFGHSQKGRSHGVFLARRPGYGTLGKHMTVFANHYRVRFRSLKIFHYDVLIKPEPPKSFRRDIINLAVETYGEEKLGGACPAYDGHRSLYITRELSEEIDMVVGYIAESDGSTKRYNMYKITLRQASVLDLTHLQDFLEGRQRILPQDTLQCLDIVLREAATRCFVAKGRCFYGKHFGEDPLMGGLVLYKGFYQSIRPAQDGLLTLNLDVAGAPFISPVFVPEYLRLALQIKDLYDLDKELSRSDGYGDATRVKAKKLLKGIKIEATHNKEGRRKYRIKSLSEEPLYSLRFLKNGEAITVMDYFVKMYNYKIRLPGLPAIESGSKENKRYLPMEVCRILEGQPFLKAINGVQRRGITAATCVGPDKRRSITDQIHKELVSASRSITSEFGVQINKLTTEIPARVLPAPFIQYQSEQLTPGEGSWNMQNKVIYKGCRIDRWSLINFCSDLNDRDIERFCDRFPQECETYGIVMNPNMAVKWISRSKCDAEGAIKVLYEACIRATNKELDLLLCVMPEMDNKSVYASVKRVCDIELGLVTQCCLSYHIRRCRSEYIANLLLKINAKLGGYNTLLVDEKNKQLPLISDVPSVIIGIDVSHPKASDGYGPSISAAAASMDWPFFGQYEAIVQIQRQRGEVCEGLYWENKDAKGSKQSGGVFKELLWSFYERSGHKPERIIFYRDGVSEGEFEAVLNNEVEAVKRACEALGWGSCSHCEKRSRPEESMPKITFIVVQKSHHTRFFPKDKRASDGNIIPGTIVDSVICHPNHFDFYLCSHYGLRGTSRPAHYHVLMDENNFSVDEIQRLTHDLCFTYARSTRAVSTVPACYYAHLAAVRARLWIRGDNLDYSGASSIGSSRSGFYRSRGPTCPLPSLHEKIKRSMFYI